MSVLPSVNSRRRYHSRVEETYFDDLLQATAKKQKEKLASCGAIGGERSPEKEPDKTDYDVLERIAKEPIPHPVPVVRMMQPRMLPGVRCKVRIPSRNFTLSPFLSTAVSPCGRLALVEGFIRLRSALQPRLLMVATSQSGVGHARLNRYCFKQLFAGQPYLKGFVYIAHGAIRSFAVVCSEGQNHQDEPKSSR